jgi:CRP-like cAMP-binding protein
VTEETRFRKNKTIFEIGSESNMLYIVKEGGVRLSFSADGQAPDTQELKPGELLNGATIVRGHRHTATASATKLNTRLLAIPVDKVRALVDKSPEVGKKLNAVNLIHGE